MINMPPWCWKILARISPAFCQDLTKWDIQQFLGVPNNTEWSTLFKECFLELFGTAIIVYFGCSTAMTSNSDVVQISFAFGLAVFVSVHLTAPVTGGYLNPALALASLFLGRLSLVRTLLFIIFQCLGSVIASGLLLIITPREIVEKSQLGSNTLWTNQNETCKIQSALNETCIDFSQSVDSLQGFTMELIITFVFVLVVASLTDPAAEQYWCPPLMIGLTVTLCHLIAIPYTGCSLNPARSFGPAVIMGQFQDHWVFWMGPISGSVFAAIVHYLLLKTSPCDRYQVNQEKITRMSLEEMESKM